MKPTAIVYTSKTGHTEAYAKLLSGIIGLPAYSVRDAKKLPSDTEIIYMGWLAASVVTGYAKACKKWNITSVIAVGLCDTGALVRESRAATSIPAETPLFTVQGGMDHSKLKGTSRLVINMLRKGLEMKQGRTEGEERMLSLLQNGGYFVSEENLSAYLEMYREKCR